MGLDTSLLRSSFELAVERSPRLVPRFYEVLFARYPQARPLFHRNDLERQAKMLTDALVAVVDHLEDAPWLRQTLTGLGAKHVEYGVAPEMFGWVGECLLATLAEVTGEAWSPRVEAAWRDAYLAISALMREGMELAPARGAG